ncbi:histone deacetylase [Ramlibacter sp. 2FC]|uniref:histone deacetylase family protein n=1 Tax=Ramlibacter sp. 2FC TaxID=2502188 RepID=UPI0010F970E1|nr:histone deacetylase [Ramlibacter sp. 2FC]
MQAYYSDHYVLPLPEGHRFPMAKYRLLRERLVREMPQLRLQEAPAASDGELALAHSPDYVEAIATGRVSAEMMREIGFPWSPAMVERSRRSAGATVAAARVAMRQGVAANLAGGTHHASAERGGGFCVFNDVAVAARLMQAEHARPHARHFVSSLPPEGAVGCLGAARRQPGPPLPLQVAVIDLDVHQGNGTARIFARDPSVFTLSLHGEKNFPFRKEASDLDVNLPDGCGDDAYLQALDGALDELGRRFEPGLLFYLAGADPHQGDRLGRLKLSDDGLEARDRRVFDWAWQRRIPLVLTMAGGYGVDIATTVQVQCNTYRVALAYWQRWQALSA